MNLAKRIALIVSPCLLSFAAFAAAPDCAPSPRTPWPTQDWEASTPEAQGMDSAALARLVDDVGANKQDSLLVIRHGKLVLDAYYAPYAPKIRHDLRSVTKSFIGTLAAIALKQGYFDRVDRPVVDLFADLPIENLDGPKRAMTVQNLLDMTSGIQWDEHGYTADEPIALMYKAPNPTAFVLSQPMSDPPGARFRYNGGNPYVVSALLTRTTGRDALDFARDELFKPLGISSVRWGDADAQGVTDGESGLFLTPHDMAKLGYLYLHDGLWDGQQLISPAWVERVRQGPVTASDGFHYGDLWWSLPERGAYMALGRHSQSILVLPKLDVVAVLTGVMNDGDAYPKSRLIDEIEAAIKSDGAIAPDPAASSALGASLSRAAVESVSSAPAAPDLAKVVSGKTYRFGDNELRLKTLALSFAGAQASLEIATASQRLGRPIARFSGAVGLDGRYAKTARSVFETDAIKGRWIDNRTFEVERRILGHSEVQTWTLAFDGLDLDLNFRTTDGAHISAHGRSDE